MTTSSMQYLVICVGLGNMKAVRHSGDVHHQGPRLICKCKQTSEAKMNRAQRREASIECVFVCVLAHVHE